MSFQLVSYVTSASKKPGQTTVVIQYYSLSRFFWNRCYFVIGWKSCRWSKNFVALSFWQTVLRKYMFSTLYSKSFNLLCFDEFLFCFLASCVKCDGPVTGNGSSGGNRRQHIYQGLQCRTVLEDISDDDQEDGDTVDEVNFSSFF